MRQFLMVFLTSFPLLATQNAKEGDTVKIHYMGTLEDGSIFDSSKGREPLKFTLGQHEVIPGFEEAVLGMKVGETKKISIPPKQAYGEINPEFIQKVPRSQLPQGDFKPGTQLVAYTQDEKTQIFTVIECNQDQVTLDGNHPMAGKTLNFDLELVEIVK